MTSTADTPKRIQRKRTKGWTMPEDAVYVGRPSKWGNPWPVHAVLFGAPGGWPLLAVSHSLAEALFRTALYQDALPYPASDVLTLRGHDLVCWCPIDAPCHADVLLELANV